jgi:hypothetical protein
MVLLLVPLLLVMLVLVVAVVLHVGLLILH